MTFEHDRALATIETITSLHPISGADAIERARIRGWDVVVKRGKFAVGDPCVYFEIDSHLDVDDPRFAFLAFRGVRTNSDGFTGHVLKTARLRGVYSQGLVIPLVEFPELADLPVAADVTSVLKVIKWDPPIPAEIAASVLGTLPSTVSRTVEARVQNLPGITDLDGHWIATEKIDGMSMSVWSDPTQPDPRGVGGRRYAFLPNPNQSMWRLAMKLGLHEKLESCFPGMRAVIQGEFYGPGVRPKNPLQVAEQAFATFTLTVDGRELPRNAWPDWALTLAVPVYELPYPASAEEAIEQVIGLRSLINPARPAEGVVWRLRDATNVTLGGQVIRASWKAISPAYAMKNDA